MRILAIESSAVTASVAILEDDTLVAEYTINHKMKLYFLAILARKHRKH